MAEFKHGEARDRFCLMEVNPKLWGSLDIQSLQAWTSPD
jgi:hypothetical protein